MIGSSRLMKVRAKWHFSDSGAIGQKEIAARERTLILAIPQFHEFLRPLLELSSDGNEHSLRSAAQEIADRFSLSEEDRRAMLPSGNSTYLRNRIGWARTYLKKAGLLEIPREAHLRITDLGRSYLKTAPNPIKPRDLEQFHGFHEFTHAEKASPSGEPAIKNDELTPDEIIQKAHAQYVDALAEDLLTRIMQCPPDFFERLVVRLLVAIGYGGSVEEAGQAVGKSGDEGIDGIINEDALGLGKIYIQAKRWSNVVGGPENQKFVGALAQKKANKGVFITTSRFSAEALNVAATVPHTIVLIDGEMLSNLMIKHQVGVSVSATYKLQRIDEGFFEVD